MKFISYWYDCDPNKKYYENCYIRLKKQLDLLGYEYSIENLKIKNPNYKTINFYKPTFILNKLKELNDSVIWMDIDCSFINKVDELFDIDCDVGMFMRDKRYDIGQPYYEIGTPHASFMYFNKTEKAIDFLIPWEEQCKKAMEDPNIKETEHAYLINYFRNTLFENTKICKLENYCTSNVNEIKNHKIFVGISQAGINYDNGNCGWSNIG